MPYVSFWIVAMKSETISYHKLHDKEWFKLSSGKILELKNFIFLISDLNFVVVNMMVTENLHGR